MIGYRRLFAAFPPSALYARRSRTNRGRPRTALRSRLGSIPACGSDRSRTALMAPILPTQVSVRVPMLDPCRSSSARSRRSALLSPTEGTNARSDFPHVGLRQVGSNGQAQDGVGEEFGSRQARSEEHTSE